MISSEVQRTLVKSPPELWNELGDPESLARHLGEFGEIRITRAEPEKLVEWEGERASGTIALKASGWGTRVTLTVQQQEQEPAPQKGVAQQTGGDQTREGACAPAPVAEEPRGLDAAGVLEREPQAAAPAGEDSSVPDAAPSGAAAETEPAASGDTVEPIPAPSLDAVEQAPATQADPVADRAQPGGTPCPETAPADRGDIATASTGEPEPDPRTGGEDEAEGLGHTPAPATAAARIAAGLDRDSRHARLAELWSAPPLEPSSPAPTEPAPFEPPAPAGAEPAASAPTPSAAPRRGFFARLFGRRRGTAAPARLEETPPEAAQQGPVERAEPSTASPAATVSASTDPEATQAPVEATAPVAAPERVAAEDDRDVPAEEDGGSDAAAPGAPVRGEESSAPELAAQPLEGACEDALEPAGAGEQPTSAAAPLDGTTGPCEQSPTPGIAAGGDSRDGDAAPSGGAELALDGGATDDDGDDDARRLGAELAAAEEISAEQVKAVLTGVLDRLGAAHHRPFSRA